MDKHNLKRFKDSQSNVIDQVFQELKDCRKESHWMWYVFPQNDGHGSSPNSKLYSIKSVSETKAYLNDEILGERLRECCILLLKINNIKDIKDILGRIDAWKLKSSMTLFYQVSKEQIFKDVLEKYYSFKQCKGTIRWLNDEKTNYGLIKNY
tara:strand:- start:2483 stop:2938 length:456 start_codon:yes stop_codon:yes gene_type:complete